MIINSFIFSGLFAEFYVFKFLICVKAVAISSQVKEIILFDMLFIYLFILNITN